MTRHDTAAPRWGAARGPGGADRLLVVLSDVEMGAGGPWDDFPHDEALGELLLDYAGAEHRDRAVDVIFNGDTFDFLKTGVETGAGLSYPHHITEEVALAKLDRVARAHGRFFAAVAELCATLGERGRVQFVVGNHDAELLFPAVQERIRTLCGGSDRVAFPGLSLDIGRVHVEHGNQLDPLFTLDEAEPFVTHGGQRLLNITWAMVALLDVAIPLQPILHHHDRLKPRQRLLSLVPEIRELMTRSFWTYWTRDYWKEFWSGDDPVKTVSWPMVKELTRRLLTWDPEVGAGDDLERRLVEDDRYDLYLVGHLHEPMLRSDGRRKILRTGAMRDEFALGEGGAAQIPINKSFAEVLLAGDEVVRSELRELPPLPRPEGDVPESIFSVVPRLRELIASSEPRPRPWLVWESPRRPPEPSPSSQRRFSSSLSR